MPANSIFSGPITSNLNAMRSDEKFITCQNEKGLESETVKGFKFCTFIGRFEMAVKGLNPRRLPSAVRIRSG